MAFASRVTVPIVTNGYYSEEGGENFQKEGGIRDTEFWRRWKFKKFEFMENINLDLILSAVSK